MHRHGTLLWNLFDFLIYNDSEAKKEGVRELVQNNALHQSVLSVNTRLSCLGDRLLFADGRAGAAEAGADRFPGRSHLWWDQPDGDFPVGRYQD